MPPILDTALFTGWASHAVAALERHRAEIDRINVFPVPDGDTGTNLLLTMRSAAEALAAGEGPAAAALARGALLGARGNSGVILSQVLRGVSDAVAAKAGPSAGGRVLADGLGRAHRLATAAITRPREGTALSVLSAAAVASVAVGSDRLDAVAVAAADAAGAALRETTGQLPELARAGVVDAGGLGLYLVLEALAALVSSRPDAELPQPSELRGPAPQVAARQTCSGASGSGTGFAYEVMFLLDAPATTVDTLREELDLLGDSVAVVGDGERTWNVHVHVRRTDVGAAIEAGIVAGRPSRITVERFADQPAPDRFHRSRAVLLVADGAELTELAGAAGADVAPRAGATEQKLTAALTATGSRHVVLLPATPELTAVAEAAAATARRDGQEVLVLPTASVLQGLAALAVHDPGRRATDDVVAMAEAAALTRTAALLVAETEALTWVGRCEPGDVLGISDGEVVLIAPDLAVGALWLAHRMLTAGGEIVTALLGVGVEEDLGDGLAADLRRTHPEVDVVIHRGGQTDHPLVLGVE